MTLADLAWDEFKNYLSNDRKRLSLEESSLWAESSKYRTLQRFFIDKDFNAINMNSFFAYANEKGWSNAYKNKFVSTAKNIARYLAKYKQVPNELTDLTSFKVKTQTRNNKDMLTLEEIKLLGTVDIKYRNYRDRLNQRNKLLCDLIAQTGGRIGEIINLKQYDVTSEDLGGFVFFRDTKNGEDREVPISMTLYNRIKQMPENKEGYVFVSVRTGKKLRSQEICLDWKRRAQAVGIKKNITNHLFRHTYITRMVENSPDIMGISKIVGHKNPKTTMGYAHTSRAYLTDVALQDPMRRDESTFERSSKKIIDVVKKTLPTNIVASIQKNKENLIITVPRYGS